VLAQGGIGLAGPVQRGDEIWWSELRPAESGRVVLVCRGAGGSPVDALGPPWSARNRVHEYGGGAWWLGAGAAVYFTNWSDQRLYRFRSAAAGGNGADASGAGPEPLTPEPPTTGAWRYADGQEHPAERWLVCVRERHGDHDEAINELVAISLDPGPVIEPRVLGVELGAVAQADFVAAPRFSHDGRWLSWIRWNHPNMPWDGTELCVAPVFGGLRLGNTQVVAGGTGEAVHGADWTSDGRLVFSSDRNGYWNLHHWHPAGNEVEAVTTLTDAEIGAPLWVLGTQRWVELSDGRLAAVVTRAATDSVVVLDDGAMIDLGVPQVEVASLSATDRDTLLIGGSTPTDLRELVEIDLAGEVVTVHRPSDSLGIDPAWFSIARPITCTAGEGSAARPVHAFLYPPTAPDLVGPAGERPPLVVMGHGGPTGHASPGLNLKVQYWTSRGFAVADVNYGGSSGFGRDYRRLLDGAWGIVDVEDCVTVAARLAADGLVDTDRMAVRGGSAGGFTVLRALQESEVFSAGTSLYGVADLEALVGDTHKFESRYLDGLVGPYPAAKDRYQQRSPMNHIDDLSCPLLVLQGLEDEIVPPGQAEAIVGALVAKGIPHVYVAFEGEQHGFRQAPNIIRSYEVELWFYGKVFGFEPADAIEAPEGAVGL
jgi:dipeptidyl aminopeptidase/acylaminoacyl peptidase